MMTGRLAAICATCMILGSTVSDAAEVAGLFSRGNTHFSIVAGNGYAFNESYLVVGAGISYYLFDGFNVGLHAEAWTGADPNIYKITPSVQYVFYQIPRFSPYVGIFYRHTDIDGLPDLDSTGARAGVYFPLGRHSYMGVGAVYENYLDCSASVYRDCTEVYPEFNLTFAF